MMIIMKIIFSEMKWVIYVYVRKYKCKVHVHLCIYISWRKLKWKLMFFQVKVHQPIRFAILYNVQVQTSRRQTQKMNALLEAYLVLISSLSFITMISFLLCFFKKKTLVNFIIEFIFFICFLKKVPYLILLKNKKGRIF